MNYVKIQNVCKIGAQSLFDTLTGLTPPHNTFSFLAVDRWHIQAYNLLTQMCRIQYMSSLPLMAWVWEGPLEPGWAGSQPP